MFIKKIFIRDQVAFFSLVHKIQFKKRTKKIIGCGFPHFLNQFMQIAGLCEFFIVPDENYQNIYTKQVRIRPISQILQDDLNEFFIVCFSYNNYALINKLIQYGLNEDNIEYVDVDYFLEINKEKFSLLTNEEQLLKAPEIELIGHDFDKFCMHNAMKVAGKNQIYLLSNAQFDFSYLSMEDSQINLYNNMNLMIENVYMKRRSEINVYESAFLSAKSLYLCDHVLINIYSGRADFGHVYIGSNTRIMVYDYLHIGNDCLISWNVSIMDGDAHMLKIGSQINRYQPIIIHDHVWIGSNVTILKGVEIGEGSVIGSGSVVTKSIPSHSLAVGNPAKVIKQNIIWRTDYL